MQVSTRIQVVRYSCRCARSRPRFYYTKIYYTKSRVTDPQLDEQHPPGSARPCRRGCFLSHPERRGSYMNARFLAGLAVAAIPIMSLLGAASASADNNTVGQRSAAERRDRPCRWAQRGPCGRHGRRQAGVALRGAAAPAGARRHRPELGQFVLPRRRHPGLGTLRRSRSLTETGPGSPSARTRGLPVLVSSAPSQF